jgi:TPR repeat protein
MGNVKKRIVLALIALFCAAPSLADTPPTFAEISAKAEQGDVRAEVALGVMYAEGDGVTRDYVEAVQWYRKSAEQGNAYAQYYLGGMYYYGAGVAQDCAEAMRWFRMAASQGDAQGKTALGVPCSYTAEALDELNDQLRQIQAQQSAAPDQAPPVSFPIVDVHKLCIDQGGSGCEYREQTAYDQAKLYWQMLNDRERLPA